VEISREQHRRGENNSIPSTTQSPAPMGYLKYIICLISSFILHNTASSPIYITLCSGLDSITTVTRIALTTRRRQSNSQNTLSRSRDCRLHGEINPYRQRISTSCPMLLRLLGFLWLIYIGVGLIRLLLRHWDEERHLAEG
jgi:hypothetical protein